MPDLLRLGEQHQAALHRLDDDATHAATGSLADRLDGLQQDTLRSWLAEFGTVRAKPTPQQLATFTAPLESRIRAAYQQSMDEAVAAAAASVDQARQSAAEQARQTVNQTPPASGQNHVARDAALVALLALLLGDQDHHLPGLPDLDLSFSRRKTRLVSEVRVAMEEERDAAVRILRLLTTRAGHSHLAGRRLVGNPPGGLSQTLLRVVDAGSFSGVQEALGRARRGITRIRDLMSHEIIDVSGVIVEAVAARLGLGRIWVAEFDSHACLTCLALSGEIVKANEGFPVEQTWDRHTIPYQGRLRRPPRHNRCRCHTMLVMVDQPVTAALARGLQERARLIAGNRAA